MLLCFSKRRPFVFFFSSSKRNIILFDTINNSTSPTVSPFLLFLLMIATGSSLFFVNRSSFQPGTCLSKSNTPHTVCHSFQLDNSYDLMELTGKMKISASPSSIFSKVLPTIGLTILMIIRAQAQRARPKQVVVSVSKNMLLHRGLSRQFYNNLPKAVACSLGPCLC